MKLNVNLAAIPDKVPLLDVGQYDFTIMAIEFKEAQGEMKAGFSFKLKVQDGPHKDGVIFDNFPQEFLSNENHPVTVKFGHLCRSAGVPMTSDGIEMDDLIGKTVQGTVAHRNYVDKTTQETKTASGVKDYIYKA